MRALPLMVTSCQQAWQSSVTKLRVLEWQVGFLATTLLGLCRAFMV